MQRSILIKKLQRKGVNGLKHAQLPIDPLLHQGFEAFHIQLAQQPTEAESNVDWAVWAPRS